MMKSISVKQASLSFALALLLPSYALERPEQLDTSSVPAVVPAEPLGGLLNPRSSVGQEKASPLKEATIETEEQGYLGVSGDPLSDLLKGHLKLEGGLVLTLVAPDSPAARAGLLINDILTSVDGELVLNQDSLSRVIKSRQPGEEVGIGLIRDGETMELNAQLAAYQRPQIRGMARGRDVQRLPGNQLLERLGRLESLEGLRELEGLQSLEGLSDLDSLDGAEMMKKLLEFQMDGLPGGFLDLQLDQGFDSQDLEGNTFDNLKGSMNRSVTIIDQGLKIEVASDMAGGTTHLKIEDDQGEVRYDGPYNGKEDIEALPDDLQNRIQKLIDTHPMLNDFFTPKKGR